AYRGARDIVCVNRTEARARVLAERVQARVLSYTCLPEALARADVVITATAAPRSIIHADDLRSIMARRGGRPIWFVDIAVPRDVDASVDELPGVHRYDIDDLRLALDANLARRRAAVPEVEAIV